MQMRIPCVKTVAPFVVLLAASTGLLVSRPLWGQTTTSPPGWVSDHITLYYFDDVPRLMQVMGTNPTLKGGDSSLQTAADTARASLLQKTQDLESKRQALNDVRTELAAVQAKLSQVLADDRAAVKAATDEANQTHARLVAAQQKQNTAQLRVNRLQNDVTAAQGDVTAAQNDVMNAATPADKAQAQKALDAAQKRVSKKTAELNDAKVTLDTATMEADQAKTADDAAQTQLTNAQNQLNTDQNGSTGAASKVTDAQNAVKSATSDVQAAATDMALTADLENRAFARARDNVPFWVSGPPTTDTSDPDPVHRVWLYGFPDSKVLFIRGPKDDVQSVKSLIAKFDVPQAQAVMTLWTLELSSDGSTRGAARAQNALWVIAQELAVASAQTDAMTSLLRECITQVVDEARATFVRDHADLVAHVQPEFIDALAFYDCDVLYRLGWRKDYIDKRVDASFLKAAMPEPRGTTTLAEALVVLSLARQDMLAKIMERFDSNIHARIQQTTHRTLEELQAPGSAKSALAKDERWYATEAFCPSLRQFVGVQDTATGGANGESTDQKQSSSSTDGQHSTDVGTRREAIVAEQQSDNAQVKAGAGISSFRREVVSYLQRNRFTAVYDYVTLLAEQVVRFGTGQANEPKLTLAEQANLLDRIKPAAQLLLEDAGLGGNIFPSPSSPQALLAIAQLAESKLEASESSSANAREAAANEALKEYILAVSNDLQRQFVEPMFYRLRMRLVQDAKVGVGVLQRTSVLASDRLVARVDPSASAQLAMGEQVNILQDVIQLTKLIGAAQTGGATAALSGLERLPPDAPPGVYGISTGNMFEVTPIVDPTGQALRFRFDHVLSTQIREPNNTTNPQLPRIERHGVNTEVQLSNQEIRVISQFDSNAKLGLPDRRSGGIPILKELPLLRDIPLVGWFTLSKGKAAVVQQSLILGQTTTFPTIREVTQLLTARISSSPRTP